MSLSIDNPASPGHHPAAGNEPPQTSHEDHRVLIGDEHLVYRQVFVRDDHPTGREVLLAADARPPENYLLMQFHASGLLEELNMDERTSLQAPATDRFVVFRTDRSYRFELDGRSFEWGTALISGATLKKLADVDPATYGVWLEVPGHDDRPIGDTETVDLSAPGVERFFTGIVKTTEG
jgi:hypothetical protein